MPVSDSLGASFASLSSARCTTGSRARWGWVVVESRADGAVAVVVQEQERGVETSDEDRHRQIVQEFLATARKRFKTVADSEARLRQEMRDDLRFMAGEQWPKDIEAERALDGRPCLTINRLPQFRRQITNQQRSSRPAIQVNPVDGGADPATAEVFQGVIRSIERQSDADIAYMTAGEHQVTMGRGYWRVLTQYEHDTGFDQVIRIRRIRNAFTVYLDVATAEVDGSDARYGFLIEDVPLEEYKERFPGSAVASLNDFASIGDDQREWMPEGHAVRIAEYFYTELVRDTLVLLNNAAGQTTKAWQKNLPATLPSTYRILQTREVQTRRVFWALINGVEVLDGNGARTAGKPWPGRYIPIVPVYGDEYDLNGRIDYQGLTRGARDPQRMFNYWRTAETEMIALAPKAPWLVAEGQIENYETMWKQANTRNFVYLPYKPQSVNQQLVPPPQRQFGEPPIQAIVMATRETDNDLKSVTGFYDASLGERGPEQSGKAILARQKQGDIGNANYLDNLARAIRYTGRILIDLIPKIYDVPRVLRITGLDEQERDVAIHAGTAPQNFPLPPGVEKLYDLSVGRYDVTVSVGPSYESRRQEAVASLVQFVQAYPDAFPIMADLLAKNMDWPGAQQVAERLKKWAISRGALPPDDAEAAKLPPEAQAQIAALQQQIQQVTQALEAAQQAIQTDRAKAEVMAQLKQAEIESRERIVAMQVQADLLKTQATLDEHRSEVLIKQEIDRLKQVLSETAKARAGSRRRVERDPQTQLITAIVDEEAEPGATPE